MLGVENCEENFVTSFYEQGKKFDKFTQINVVYPNAVATARVGVGVKSEGELIISGTKGYVYVPAPWWKTDYFEIRYEDQTNNKRYFYQLDGEGIRYGIVAFVRSISNAIDYGFLEEKVSIKIADVFEKYRNKEKMIEIKY